MTCHGCGAKVVSDGHGEPVHVVIQPNLGVEAYRYGCKPGKVRENEDYPVAS